MSTAGVLSRIASALASAHKLPLAFLMHLI